MLRNFLLITLLMFATADFDYEYLLLDKHQSSNDYQFLVDPPLPATKTRGLLYPRDSESRQVRLLDGIWDFVKSDETDPMRGVRDGWYKDDLRKFRVTIPMPVPGSYNDITTEQSLRDHVGTVWYERKLFIPRAWALDKRVWLRFGSVHYSANVWLNGKNLTQHEIGHLPFEVEITSYAKYGAENRLTVLCDNTLSKSTVPQGTVQEQPSENGTTIVQTYIFDFFNYAGIHRSVHLYTTPKVFIEDIAVTTELDEDKTGYINYEVTSNGEVDEELFVQVQLRNKEGELVSNNTSEGTLKGKLEVPQAQLWWPYLMHPEPGYLYTLELYLHAADKTVLDVYRLKVGIRTLQWTNSSVLLNGKPIYLRGFGRHEDSDIHGRGLDYALLARDFNLLKWTGANAYRTSHYPYSEESMQFADEQGIMIIDECPFVAATHFETVVLLKHKSSLEQLIHRDRNHPSVIMWSIANEPMVETKEVSIYFENVVSFAKYLDPTRPITASLNKDAYNSGIATLLDVISFNTYNGWYQNPGHLDMIYNWVIYEVTRYNKQRNKPIVISEYGADTQEGLHFLPHYLWSEDYQTALLSKHFKAFDFLRQQKWFIGEFVWNFADFKTSQQTNRVGGNKKGVFSRNRQPKAAAYVLRQRYYSLAHLLDNCEVPADLFPYVVNFKNETFKHDSSDL